MTIIEALKSGLRFRRPGNQWLYPTSPGESVVLAAEDILARDWEIEDCEKDDKNYCGAV